MQHTGHARFHLARIERLHAVPVVGHCVQHSATGNHGHAHPVHLRVQKVFAMPGRVHPLIVNHACRRTNGNILLNQLEVCAGLSCTAGQVCHLASG